MLRLSIGLEGEQTPRRGASPDRNPRGERRDGFEELDQH
jgi:hypothetical protein